MSNSTPTFQDLLRRKGLSQKDFAERVESAWASISGRKLSRQAVNAWIRGREIPKLSPNETLILIEILECTLSELAFAFREQEIQNR